MLLIIDYISMHITKVVLHNDPLTKYQNLIEIKPQIMGNCSAAVQIRKNVFNILVGHWFSNPTWNFNVTIKS